MGNKPTVREMLSKKPELIRANQADLGRKIAEAPAAVQREYERCQRRISDLLKGRAGSFEDVLWSSDMRDRALTELEAAWLLDLLSHRANGWDVSLTKPLGGGGPTTLTFRFDPHED